MWNNLVQATQQSDQIKSSVKASFVLKSKRFSTQRIVYQRSFLGLFGSYIRIPTQVCRMYGEGMAQVQLSLIPLNDLHNYVFIVFIKIINCNIDYYYEHYEIKRFLLCILVHIQRKMQSAPYLRCTCGVPAQVFRCMTLMCSFSQKNLQNLAEFILHVNDVNNLFVSPCVT